MKKEVVHTSYEFQWAEQHSMISANYWADAYGPYRLGKPKAVDVLLISQDGYLHAYAARAMLEEWRLLSKKLLTTAFRKAALRTSARTRERYGEMCAQLRKVHIRKVTNVNLQTALAQYLNCLCAISHHFVVSQPEGIFAVTETIKNRLKKKKAAHHLYTLLTATVPDIIVREQKDRFALAQEKNITDEQLKKHALKHAWLFFNSYDAKANLHFLKERLGEHFDETGKREAALHLKARQEQLFQEINDPLIQELCEFLQALSIERLELKDCWGGAEYRCLPLFEELANRIVLPLEVMMRTYAIADYENFLRKGKRLGEETLTARERGYAFRKHAETITLHEHEEELKSIRDTVHTREATASTGEIKGEGASSGRAKGICRIIETRDIARVLHDLKRFKRGDILVTHMTQPNMMPIALRASAIVADEGGITSHAAVIARELRIPCVVGTKVATKVLKDGMTIEVDGGSGKITVLEK